MNPRVLSGVLALFVAVAGLMFFLAPQTGISTRSHRPPFKMPDGPVIDRDLFSATAIPHIAIEIPPAGIRVLQQYHWQRRNDESNRRPVRATVYEGGVTYTNVAVHLKGSAGSFRTIHDNPALTLNFEKFAEGQQFHGLKKIHLNNSVQDPSLLSEQLCRELCLEAGVPTPRATQARVTLNGRELGLYVLVEGWNKQFLKRHFPPADGTLFDGGFAVDIDAEGDLEVDFGPEKEGRAALAQLIHATRTGPLSARKKQLESILDVDRFLSFLAMEIMLGHGDGYAMNRNNYRVYHNAANGLIYFMPHGMDQTFGTFQVSVRSPIVPRMNALVAQSVLAVPEYRARYLDRVGTLLTNVFREAEILQRLDERATRIGLVLDQADLGSSAEHSEAARQLQNRVRGRIQSMAQQLASRPEPINVTRSGVPLKSGWLGRATKGRAEFSEVTHENGSHWLKIDLKENGTASWRRNLLLPEGRYLWTGRARLFANSFQIIQDPLSSGICLRLSGDTAAVRIQDTNDWVDLSFEFAVEGESELVLVAELRAARGQATFDASSFRLSKLD